MKPLGWVLAVLVALVALKLYVAGERKDAQRVAELARRDVTLDSLARIVADSEQARLVERQRVDSVVMTLRVTIVRDSTLADSLKAAGVARYVELRGAMPPDLRPLLDSLQQTHARQVDTKDSVIGALNDVVVTVMGERQRSDSLMAGYQQALALALSQRDGWKTQAGKRDWLACTAGPSWSNRGPGVGVTCGLKVL